MAENSLTALALANDIRSRRAAEKKRIFALPRQEGRNAVADLIEELPDWLESERLTRFLSYPQRSGEEYARKIRLRASNPYWPIGEDVRLRDLTADQRERIALYLREGV